MKNIEEIKAGIKKLSAERNELTQQVNDKQQEINELFVEEWKLKYGFDIGSEVLIKQERGRLTGFEIICEMVRPVINKYKKDQTLSKNNIWSWNSDQIKHFIPENPK